MKNYEYVASGMSMARVDHSFYKKNPEIDQFIKGIINEIPSDIHEFSILYNALVEKAKGVFLTKNFRDNIDNLYTDSGGLQMVTRGMTATEKDRENVYNTQSESDFAMSFDEIPVRLLSEKSDRKREDLRIFDKDMLIPCARKSGENIRKQIEFFHSIGSKTKPIMILQGNSAETYRIWIEEMLKEIPRDYWSDLNCVASGAAALGNGTLEDIQRVYYTKYINEYIDVKHLHLLAIGSHKRLIPTVLLHDNILTDYKISYDSTKHTCAAMFGYFQSKNGQAITLRRRLTEYKQVLDEMNEHFDVDIDVKKFYDIMNHSPTDYFEKYKDYQCIKYYAAFCFICMKNFVKNAEVYIKDSSNKNIHQYLGDDVTIVGALRTIRDDKDFAEWEGFAHKNIRSKRVKAEAAASFEDMFVEA